MSRLRTLARSAALLAFASLTLAACGDDDPSGPSLPGEGQFNLTVDAGSQDTTFTGAALFGSAEGEFVLELGTLAEGPAHAAAFFIHDGAARPAVGNYTMFDMTGNGDPTASQFGAVLFIDDEENTWVFGSTGGTFRVTKSSAEQFAGSFTLEAEGCAMGDDCEDPEARVPVEIRGTFNASAADETNARRASTQIQSIRALPRR